MYVKRVKVLKANIIDGETLSQVRLIKVRAMLSTNRGKITAY